MNRMKYILTIVCWWMSVCLSAHTVGAEALRLSVQESADQQTWKLDVDFDNAATGNYTAFQMDLSLPAEFVADEASLVAGARLPLGYVLSITRLADGQYRILGYSGQNKEIQGNTGNLFSLNLGQVTNAACASGYTIGMSHVLFAKRDGTECALADVEAKVFTLSCKVGTEVLHFAVQEGKPIVLAAVPQREGHTFSWVGTVPEFMPAHNVEVQGKFTINQYHFVCKSDGLVVYEAMVDYGAPLTYPTEIRKVGYTHTGWDTAETHMPAHDLEAHAVFQVNQYQLTYMVDGAVYRRMMVDYGSAIVPLPDPQKGNFQFSGWSEIPPTMPAHDVTITGSFMGGYLLTFKIDDEVYYSARYEAGAAIVYPEAPVKEGHTFKGWDQTLTVMPAKDVTIQGLFDVNTYHLVLKVEGQVVHDLVFDYGAPIVLPEPPAKEGHTFEGWQNLPKTMPATDMESDGAYTINTYLLSLKLDGSLFKTMEVLYDTPIVLPAAPVKEGHTFGGWGTVPDRMPARDIEVLGTYGYTVTYTVDGREFRQEEVQYGQPLVFPETPEKEGRAFSGWREAPATMPAQNITLKGGFAYTVTYLVNEEQYELQTVYCGDALPALAEPQRVGYHFSGWKQLPEVMPAEDIVVKGGLIVNQYFVVYIVDGMEYAKDMTAYGSKLILRDAPVKTGYTFSGWSEVPATMPDHLLEVFGNFTINTYTLTYMLDGVVYATQEVTYGTPIVPLTVEDNEIRTFMGWDYVPETMPAHDVVIEGTTEMTGIDVLTMDAEVEVYSLEGRRVLSGTTWKEAQQRLSRGTYIVNGHLRYVK